MPRFFLSAPPIDGHFIITGEDAKHISFSLRMRDGEAVTVCDGNGMDYETVIDGFFSDAVSVRIVRSAPSETEPPLRILLYQSVPKGDKMDTIVQKAVELGISEIIPVYSARCIVKSDPERDGKRVTRLGRIAKEAAMQCGRGVVPRILPPMRFSDAVKKEAGKRSFLCYENESSLSLKEYLGGHADAAAGGEISFFVGPEGGYDEGEVLLAGSLGIQSVGLGKRILRCETASGYVLSCISYACDNQ